jgi:hypothetical protein
LPKSKPSPPLQLTLKPSLKLQQFNIVVHGLASIAVICSNLFWPVKLAMATFVAVSFVISRQRFLKECRIITYDDHIGWRLANGGDLEPVDILATTVVTTRLIFLHIKHKPAQLIVDDALDDDHFRQFIVKLKLTARPQDKADNFP